MIDESESHPKAQLTLRGRTIRHELHGRWQEADNLMLKPHDLQGAHDVGFERVVLQIVDVDVELVPEVYLALDAEVLVNGKRVPGFEANDPDCAPAEAVVVDGEVAGVD